MNRDTLTSVMEVVGLGLVCAAAWRHGTDVGLLTTGLLVVLLGYLLGRK